MRKIFILLFTLVLLLVTYNFYSKKETIPVKKSEQTNVSLRVEEDSSLITNEQKSLNTEEELTTYMTELNQEIDSILTKQTLTESDELTLRNAFITLTDFIFYNGTIKGKTFGELTTSAKEKVISLYEKIDSKIEAKFPGYKENIKDNSKKTYNNLKEKLNTLKTDLFNSYKSEIGEANYNDQQELLDESINTMKESFSPVVDTIVDKSKEIYETAKDKTSSWYQEWKEDNQ